MLIYTMDEYKYAKTRDSTQQQQHANALISKQSVCL